MTIDIKIAGSNVTPAQRQMWATEVTITEDASPTSLSNTFGGVGSLSVRTQTLDNTMLAQGAELEVTLSEGGTRTGVITDLSDADGIVTVAARTTMSALNRIISAPVIKTTLGDALTQYFALCGLSIDDYTIDSGIASRAILLPGWKANAWSKIKELAAVEGFDLNEIGSTIQVTPQTTHRAIDVTNAISTTRALGENVTGLNVETNLYQYAQITNKIIYPPATFDTTYGTTSVPGYHTGAEVLSVTPGSPVVKDIPLMASLTSVQQPIPVKIVGPTDESASVYTVMYKDGVETIDPEEWTRRGGYVKVEILPDTTTLRITVDAGDNLFAAAPFRIAISSGSTDYSTLRIVGSGLSIEKTRMRMPTATPRWMTDQDVASSTDSFAVRTPDQARRVLRAQSAEASLSVSSLQLQMGSMDELVGNRAGGYIQRPEANYRIRTATLNGATTSLAAIGATKVADVNAKWAGMKVSEVNAIWAGKKVRNFNSAPLLTEVPTAPTLPTKTGYGFGGYGVGPYGG